MKFLPIILLPLLLIGCGESNFNGALRQPASDVSSVRMKDYGPSKAGPSFRAPKGGLLLVYFGYTSCPDICPTTMADLRLAINDLPDSKKVVPVFVTVDPERDKPKFLNEYLSRFFGDNYQARYPDNERQLQQTTLPFGVQYRFGEKDETGNYPIDHTAAIFAVNDQGKIVAEWPFPTEGSLIAQDLRKLLSKN